MIDNAEVGMLQVCIHIQILTTMINDDGDQLHLYYPDYNVAYVIFAWKHVETLTPMASCAATLLCITFEEQKCVKQVLAEKLSQAKAERTGAEGAVSVFFFVCWSWP